jgi:hypothetical protein
VFVHTVGISYVYWIIPQRTEYTVVALHPGVFQGIAIYFIPRESGSKE